MTYRDLTWFCIGYAVAMVSNVVVYYLGRRRGARAKETSGG